MFKFVYIFVMEKGTVSFTCYPIFQGETFEWPEKVPFRMTHNLIHAMVSYTLYWQVIKVQLLCHTFLLNFVMEETFENDFLWTQSLFQSVGDTYVSVCLFQRVWDTYVSVCLTDFRCCLHGIGNTFLNPSSLLIYIVDLYVP